jgi:hypothetical protein
MNSSSRICRSRDLPPAMWSRCICIAEPLNLRWRTRMSSKTRIAGALTQPGGRSAGRWSRNGSGTCVWNWGISFILTRCASPNLLRRSPLPHRTQLPPQAMLLLRWACPGKRAASRGKTLLCSPMARCVAPLARSCCPMSTAEKPMAAYAWCMGPAFAVVVPVGYVSSVNGMGVRQQSRGRSVCYYIRSRWVAHHCSGAIGAAESTGAPASSSCDTNAWR